MSERSEDLFSRVNENGLAAVDQLIEDATSEELFLDFKRSGTKAEATKLGTDDRKNLAKAISGFGNSEGGVVFWGIDCRPNAVGADVASEKHPIQNPQRFKSWIENAIGGLTTPPHKQVENTVILENDEVGYVVTHIPKSNHAPHQVISDHRYYMRAGSSFLPVPHAVLSGMFGRRPQPRVFHSYMSARPNIKTSPSTAIEWDLRVLLRNGGASTAHFPFINLTIMNSPSSNSEVGFDGTDSKIWNTSFFFGRKLNVIGKPNLQLAPGAEIDVFDINLFLSPPFENDLHLTGQCGADGSEIFPIDFLIRKQTIENAIQEFLSPKAPDVDLDERRRILRENLLRDTSPSRGN